MRVVLLQPAPWRPDLPPLGIAYVQAALKAAGHEVRLLDLNLALYELARPAEREWFAMSHAFVWQHPLGAQALSLVGRAEAMLDRMLGDALAGPTGLVGITMLRPQKAFGLWLAARVKRLRPGWRVVVGGPQCFPQYEPAAIAADPSVDFVVVGEGEHAVVDLARWVEGGCDGAVPAGVITHTGERGPERALDRDIDRIPFPDFAGLALDRYEDRGRLPIFGSRGCVRSCVFCIEQAIWERFRYRTAPNVFAEMKRDVEVWGATKLEFNDSLFNGHVRVLEQLCDLVIADGLRVSWGGQGIIRAEMSPRLLAKLKRAGCGFVTYGFESASQKVLNAMKKNVDMKVAARVVRDTHEAGIGQKLNLMFGFPGETEADFQLTLDFLTENARYVDEVNPSDAFTAIIPGTELYDRAADFGVTQLENAWFWEAEGNDFATRLDRFERLCRHVKRLGIASTYKLEEVANRHQVLGDFAAHKQRWSEALAHYDAHARRMGIPAARVPNYGNARRRLGEALIGHR
ncbi:MAG: B12-binding domain-containing radical SAM protein [Myxococcota bacterium]